jgi:hypothetical protein
MLAALALQFVHLPTASWGPRGSVSIAEIAKVAHLRMLRVTMILP